MNQLDQSQERNPNPQSTAWCFTLNNPTDQDIHELDELNQENSGTKDGMEEPPSSGVLLTDANLASAQSTIEENRTNISNITNDTVIKNTQTSNLTSNPHHVDQNYKTLLGIPLELIKYFICQIEKGEKNENGGTDHLQGYIDFFTNQRFKRLKTFNSRMHLEVRKASRRSAITYCEKTETRIRGPFEYGIRNLLETNRRRSHDTAREVLKQIKLGWSDEKIRDENPNFWFRNFRGITEIRLYNKSRSRNWQTEVYILAGKTGIGKSSFCEKYAPNAYWKPKGEWWDGYDNEENVVLDEFYGWIDPDTMLRLIDSKPLRIPIKGGFKHFSARKLFITTNSETLINCWNWEHIKDFERKQEALLRRISEYGHIITLEKFMKIKDIETNGKHHTEIPTCLKNPGVHCEINYQLEIESDNTT
jgi:Putative viral replication protein/RNA helicase